MLAMTRMLCYSHPSLEHRYSGCCVIAIPLLIIGIAFGGAPTGVADIRAGEMVMGLPACIVPFTSVGVIGDCACNCAAGAFPTFAPPPAWATCVLMLVTVAAGGPTNGEKGA